uniref:hydroxymethylbilane synthase n=1 Tax=Glossina morsitans morsitans TaxID=37546 RepID=A0A1B0FG25_GLOMM
MASKERIRVGSRKSELAVKQTQYVIDRLQKSHPKKKFEIRTMTTIGDRILNKSLPKIGEKSLFTRDLEDALENGEIDLIVHSLKDLPTTLPNGMIIGAVLTREDPRDALVLKQKFDKNTTLGDLPKGSVIGTSSLRRTAQLRRRFPDLTVCDIRGNLNTRLGKLDADDSKFSGIILAYAGLARMGWKSRINQKLEPSELLYAVGQGALAVECRAKDTEILEMLGSVMCDVKTACCVLAERSFLKTLGGGCSAPVAVVSEFNGKLRLDGAVWSLDGTTEIRDKISHPMDVEKGKTIDIIISTGIEDEPPRKKTRLNDTTTKALGIVNTIPAPVIDNTNFKKLSKGFDIKDLVEKHVSLVKDCPVKSSKLPKHENAELREKNNEEIVHANQLPTDIGLDFMGQCPFVNDDMKIAHAISDKCPIKSKFDQKDWTNIPTSSKCPFTSLLNASTESISHIISDSAHKANLSSQKITMNDVTEKCKQKTDQVNNNVNENVFCGIYQHSLPPHNRELYEKSRKLGQMLAEQLIEKGAWDVMKSAQSEIHAKPS